MKERICLIALCVCMVLIAGCGKKTVPLPSPSPSSTAEPSPSPSPSATEPAKQEDDPDIKNISGEDLQKMADEFNNTTDEAKREELRVKLEKILEQAEKNSKSQ